MRTRSSWLRGSIVLASLAIGGMVLPEAWAKGGHRSAAVHRAPRVNAPHQNRAPVRRAPNMSRAMTPTRSNVARVNNAKPHVNNGQARAINPSARTNAANSTRALGSATASGVAAAHLTPNTYTYGHGTNARNYKAYGYGRGYRNRYQGSGYGYGRSQGNSRGIVSRLRSVHSGLARLDHDYQGHRVKAMHSISMAVRQLSHRSSIYQNAGFASGANGGRNLGNQRQAGLGASNGNGNGRNQRHLTQAQSDSRMSQSMRTLQGINMQLTNQGTNSSGHSRARGHVQHAMHELNTALTIR